MPVESAADRLSFVSPDEFGEAATYTPAGGAATPGIAGIFNDGQFSAFVGDRGAVSDSQPSFTCRSADLPVGAAGGDVGDTLALAASNTHPPLTFRVVDLQPDGAGITTILLGALV